MPRLIRPVRRAVLPALAALLILTLPVSAHPFVTGGEAPVDSLAEVTLAIAHGCGTEDAGGGDPTTEIAMEVPPDVRIVEVPEVEDYAVGLERDEDGRVDVVTWTATDGGLPAPELPFGAVFSGAAGDEVFLKVFQGCDGFSYRWIGTPDAPADDPAIRVQLIEADPDRPPPDPEPVPAPDDRDPASDDADPASDAEPEAPESEDTAELAEEPGDAAAQDIDEGGPNVVPFVAIGLLFVISIAAVLGARARRRATEGGPQHD